MQIQRPSLQKTLNQLQLNTFYEKPIARVSMSLILTILGVSFFALAAIRPTLQTMAGLIKQIDEKKILDEKLALKINALTLAQKELLAKEQRAAVLDDAIPQTAMFSQLLTALEKLASEQNISINSLNTTTIPIERAPDPTGKQALNVESVPFTMVVTGTYNELFNYLQAMQNLRRLIVVDKVVISPPSKEQKDKLNMGIAARAFDYTNQVAKKPAAQIK
ncbi:MAG TPA: type 4a pilus biogenesis protein PilO [Patescibacteria group bacterium]|nr:type 4a pilus biogenesis protein PilO [Patescibacteria group bacterium]